MAELVRELEYMPLAITQAASYISERWSRCTIPQYIEKLKKSDKLKARLLDNVSSDLRRKKQAKNSILLTWQISFEHIHETRQSAAHLLSIMSFYDSNAIPDFLLRHHRDIASDALCENEQDAESREDAAKSVVQATNSKFDISESSSDDEFEKDVIIFRQYSFISFATDAATFKILRLVQFATRR